MSAEIDALERVRLQRFSRARSLVDDVSQWRSSTRKLQPESSPL